MKDNIRLIKLGLKMIIDNFKLIFLESRTQEKCSKGFVQCGEGGIFIVGDSISCSTNQGRFSASASCPSA
jgi:hypothetical protein